MPEATKHDAKKLPLHLIPPESIVAQAEVFGFGERKYGTRNWEKGMRWSRLFGALMRHAWQWFCGLAEDRETRLSHLKAVHTISGMLVAYEEREIGIDDRPEGIRVSIWDQYESLTEIWDSEQCQKNNPY